MSKVNNFKTIHQKDIEQFIKIRKNIDKARDETIINNIQPILLLSKFTNKPFKDILEDDIQNFMWDLNKKYSPSTIDIYLSNIKTFFKFIHNKKKYERGKKFRYKIKDPDCTKWINIKFNQRDIPEDRLLKDKDIYKMLKVCDDLRDTAIVAILYDSGIRNYELIHLKIKDIVFHGDHGEIMVEKRKSYIVFAIPYLKQFLNYHLYKDYPDAPLFYSRDRVNSNIIKKMSKGQLKKEDLETLKLDRTSVIVIVKSVGKKACMKVSVHPRLLRHSSIKNHVDLGLTEKELIEMFGWKENSLLPRKYINVKNTKKKIINQFKGIEIKRENTLKPILCSKCNSVIPPTFLFCGYCGKKVDENEKIQTQKKN